MINLEQKITNAPEDIAELFTVLSTEEEAYLETFGEGLSNANYLLENQSEIVTKAFSVAFSLSPLFELEHSLKDIGYKSGDIELIINNYKEVFLPVFEEYNHLISDDAAISGNIRSELKKAAEENNSISHTDILSEIENPTPSMSTTSAFSAAKSSAASTTAASGTNVNALTSVQKVDAAPTSVINTQKPTLSAQPTPITSELGGFSATNHQNPTQTVATKLDQKLSEPSASVPKEVYVSKRPDPYKEPLG